MTKRDRFKPLSINALLLVSAMSLLGCSSGQVARNSDSVATHTTTTTVTSSGTTVVEKDLRVQDVVSTLDQKTFNVRPVREAWTGTWRFDFPRSATNVISSGGNARFTLVSQGSSFCHSAGVPRGWTAGGCFTLTSDPSTPGGFVIAKDGKAYAKLTPS